MLVLALMLGGCGGAAELASAEMALSTSGLAPSDVAAVEVLVFDGANAGCARVMSGTSPLDDAGLVLVAHALFTIDGAPKHLAIPAGKPLDFYAEALLVVVGQSHAHRPRLRHADARRRRLDGRDHRHQRRRAVATFFRRTGRA